MHFTWAYLAALPVLYLLVKWWLAGEIEFLGVLILTVLVALPLVALAQALF